MAIAVTKPMKDGAFTATSAVSATPSGGGLTTDQYKGWRVFSPNGSAVTNPVVYGNINSNSTTVLNIDQWWTAADGVGTQPAATNGYSIVPCSLARFMALTTDTAAAAAGDTVLASEIASGGCARALATYAHTGGTNTYTLQKAFSVTAPFTAIHKMALFTALSTGIMFFETVLNQDATVGNGDTLTVTETVSLSG